MAKAPSMKHLQISKANQTVFAVSAVAAVIAVFGLFIGRSVWLKYAHQERVIESKTAAKLQLQSNVDAKNQLVESYKQFVDGSKPNIIGGAVSGTTDQDGDNARIILDALPSKYDFPALATSINKMLSGNGYNVASIDGTDDELNQQQQAEAGIIEIPLGVEVENTNYTGIQNVVVLFDRSIRPFNIQQMNISGSGNAMTIKLNLLTYYQPEKKFEIGSKVIK